MNLAADRTGIPAHWQKGALLDLQRFHDGSFRATLLGEEADHAKANFVEFDSSFAAQQFVSQWYQPGQGR